MGESLATGGVEPTTETDGARGERERTRQAIDPAPELGELLSGGLKRLAAETGATAAAAWSPAGAECVRVAGFGEATPATPSRAALDAILTRDGAIDLSAGELDAELREYGSKSGFTACVPLVSGEPIAAIFLGPASGEQLGRVSPRTLTALDHFAKRLQKPAATAATIARLARMESEMLRISRLATIGDLLVEAVHEIRNPLVSVKTFLQLLPDSLDDRDFTENFRGNVIEEVRRMERLLDSLLDQARAKPEADQQHEAKIGVLLESVGQLLEKRAQQKHLRLVVDIRADLPRAAIGEDPLRQIVLNLMLNAFEASPERGCVTLSASLDSDVLLLAVDDNGPGVPEAQRTRLFDPFFSTREERPVGIGLAVCQRLVETAGGSIHVEDAPDGAGTRFCVRLPIA